VAENRHKVKKEEKKTVKKVSSKVSKEESNKKAAAEMIINKQKSVDVTTDNNGESIVEKHQLEAMDKKEEVKVSYDDAIKRTCVAIFVYS